MEKFLTISQTAKLVNMTTETLRHYDRIGLLKPSKIDEWTNYRYYSSQDIVRLTTIKALQCMGLSLERIKEILSINDFSSIVHYFQLVEQSADEKIAELERAKEKIQRARRFYESKINDAQVREEIFMHQLPQRVILLSDHLDEPSISNLHDYHRHFYAQVGDRKDDFAFEDIAGVYRSGDYSRLFAICSKYMEVDNLKTSPKGQYLCANCTETDREKTIEKLSNIAKEKYLVKPQCVIELIVLSGILHWDYQIQIYIGDNIEKSNIK